jgi:hypothetical protein
MRPGGLVRPDAALGTKISLDLDAGRGTGTGETLGRVCAVAGVGGEGFVNPKRDSTVNY